MGRVVGGGDGGDGGAGGLLPGAGIGQPVPDIADIEQYLLAATSTMQQGSVEPIKEEAAALPSYPLGGEQDTPVKVEDMDLDFDDYFAQLFPDLDTEISL